MSEFLNAEGPLYDLRVEVDKALTLDVTNVFAGAVTVVQPVFMGGKIINADRMARLELMVDEYITSGRIHDTGMPSPAAFSRHLNLSAAYLCDLLCFETGKTFAEYIQLKQIDMARKMLCDSNTAPSDVARILGFQSLQFFNAATVSAYFASGSFFGLCFRTLASI